MTQLVDRLIELEWGDLFGDNSRGVFIPDTQAGTSHLATLTRDWSWRGTPRYRLTISATECVIDQADLHRLWDATTAQVSARAQQRHDEIIAVIDRWVEGT